MPVPSLCSALSLSLALCLSLLALLQPHSCLLKLSQATKFTLHLPAASAVGGLLKLRIRRVLNEVPAAASVGVGMRSRHLFGPPQLLLLRSESVINILSSFASERLAHADLHEMYLWKLVSCLTKNTHKLQNKLPKAHTKANDK